MSATTLLPRPRAVAYARYSSEQQRAASIEDQLRNCRGVSCHMIASDLNARGAGCSSAGSTWKRTIRRCGGWVASAIRSILRNPLYTGRVRWNVDGYVRNPDTAKRVWRARPKAEWVEHQDAPACTPAPISPFTRSAIVSTDPKVARQLNTEMLLEAQQDLGSRESVETQIAFHCTA